ncbi:MAG: LacI family DNA-binding transcriptional regulator [Enterocloster asparagiformis]|nr:LacI family DNA-binding transcriptional regulator [Enterocloster asparagiformis]
MSRKSNRVTIKEVASKAGVSIATVSRIINHKDTVTSDTRQRVLDTMEQLNFVPKTISPITNSSNKIILMCVPDFDNPFNAQIIRGVQKAAHFHKYDVLFLQADDFYTSAGDYINIVKNNDIAGILMLSPIPSSKLIEELNSRCPLVMCSEYHEESSTSFVSVDDTTAVKNAINYLISTGCRKIGLINSFCNNRYARHRERGFTEALSEAGLPINQDWIAHISSISYQSALSQATYILSKEDRPDAFFAVSDVYAVAVVNAAKKMGLKVPEDVSVIGFDNVEISIMSDPQLTTIEQPCYQIGYQSCELLVEKINNPDSPDKRILLDTELIVRQSTKFNR